MESSVKRLNIRMVCLMFNTNLPIFHESVNNICLEKLRQKGFVNKMSKLFTKPKHMSHYHNK